MSVIGKILGVWLIVCIIGLTLRPGNHSIQERDEMPPATPTVTTAPTEPSVPPATPISRPAENQKPLEGARVTDVASATPKPTKSIEPTIIADKEEETTLEEMERRGNVGRLIIPDIDVDVALFAVSVYDIGSSQPIVDAKDSAAYMQDAAEIFGWTLIGDHRHQGFDAIRRSEVASTYAYLDFGDHKEKYICIDRFVGYNTGSDLVNLAGESISERNGGEICMYTCNKDDTVTITLWKKP